MIRHAPLLAESQSSNYALTMRLMFHLFGAICPLFCVVLSGAGLFNATLNTPWQSGEIEAFIALLLTWPAIGPFLPLAAFHATCMTIWVLFPRFVEFPIIRFGIYSGTVLALQFWLFILGTSQILTVLAAVIVGPLAFLGILSVVTVAKNVRRFSIRNLLALTTGIAILSVLLRYIVVRNAFLALFFYPLFGAVAATPTLNLAAYVGATIGIQKQRYETQFSFRWFGIGVLSYIFAWFGSWKFAIDLMLSEYAKLPTTEPNCYLSSAAAYGHPRFVGAHWADAHSGPMTRQMQRLKLLEFALKAASPKLHRVTRKVYDRFGPPLARVCRSNVWFADGSFLLFKPFEVAAIVVQYLAGIQEPRIRHLGVKRSTTCLGA